MSAETIARLTREVQERRSHPGFFRRLLGNAASDVVDIVTGIPGSVRFVARGAAGGAARIYDWTNLPGDEAAGRYADRSDRAILEAAKATGRQYARTYGPLFRGDLGTFGSRVVEHPVFVALDVGGATGVAGKVVGATSRGARAAGLGAEGGVLERLAARGADDPLMRRQPRRLVSKGSDDPETGGLLGDVETVDRGLYSRNPLYRELVQRPVTDPLRRRGRGVADSVLGDRAYDRAARRAARDVVLAAQDRGRRAADDSLRAFRMATRRLDKGVTARLAKTALRTPAVGVVAKRTPGARPRLEAAGRGERDAVFLHATGLLDLPDFETPRANLDAVVSWMERGIEKTKARGGKTRNARRQVERIRHLPDELLTYERLPDHVREAVDEARAVVSDTQRERIRQGFITEKTAKAVRGRAARELLGGEEDVSGFVGPAQAVRLRALDEEIAAAKAEARALATPTPRTRPLEEVRRLRRQVRDATDIDALPALREQLTEAAARLAVARGTEVGTRVEVDAARAGVTRLRRARKAIGTREGLDTEVAALERLHARRAAAERDGKAGRVADLDAKIAKRQRRTGTLEELRALQSPDRSTPAPVELRERVPGVREFVESVIAENPRARILDPDLEADPPVAAARGRTEAVVDELAQHAGRADVGSDAWRSGMTKLRKRLGQAYFEEREARLAALKARSVAYRGNPDAEHVPAFAIDPLQARPSTAIRALRPRTTPERARKGRAMVREAGLERYDVRLIESGRARAAVAAEQPRLVEEMVRRFAARSIGPDGAPGKIAVGSRALQLMRTDPERWVAVSRSSLTDTLRKLDRLEDGKFLPRETIDAVLGGDRLTTGSGASLAWREGVRPRDVVLIPRAVVEAWAEGVSPRAGGFVGTYDSLLDAWKAGVLAFHPRWLVNNLIGNTFQYGLLSGFDLRAIRDVARNRERFAAALAAAGDDMRQSSFMRESGIGDVALDANPLARAAKRVFDFNDRIEGFLREAALVSATKKELRHAGRLRGIYSTDELLGAIDDAVRNRPEIVEQALKDAKLFMGEYRRFNTFERAVMRRIAPFYSWLRVISRLAFALPFKAPLRAEALSLLTQAGYWDMSTEDRDLEHLRPVWDRGGIGLPGGLELRTTSMNPFATVAPLVEALGEGSATRFVGAAASSLTPVLTVPIQQVGGRGILGQRDFIAPPGHGDRVPLFGRGDMRVNPVTGAIETAPPVTPPLSENALQAFLPFYSSVGRGLAAGQDRPYDTASTPALISHRLFGTGDRAELFRPPPRSGRATSPLGPAGLVSVLGSEAGFPIRVRDRVAELAQLEDRLRDLLAAERSLVRRQARIGAGGR